MQYYSGEEVRVGDRVRLWENMHGQIVCEFGKQEFMEGYSSSDWSTEMKGIMILADKGDLFHYDDIDEDLELLSRME